MGFLTLLFTGCYEPSVTACAVSCSPEGGCPEDMICGAESMCVYDEATACAAIPRTTLEIKVMGKGRVRDSLNGIDCSDDCVVDLPMGTEVHLVPESDGNSQFKHWHDGACKGYDFGCSLLLDQELKTTAEFEKSDGDDDNDD